MVDIWQRRWAPNRITVILINYYHVIVIAATRRVHGCVHAAIGTFKAIPVPLFPFIRRLDTDESCLIHSLFVCLLNLKRVCPGAACSVRRVF